MLLKQRGIDITSKNLIERGEIIIDQYPTANYINYLQQASSGSSGDRYRIDDEEGVNPTKFRGYFLVDEGRFVDYSHPSSKETNGVIRVGGLPGFRTKIPDELTTSGNFFVPEIKYRKATKESF